MYSSTDFDTPQISCRNSTNEQTQNLTRVDEGSKCLSRGTGRHRERPGQAGRLGEAIPCKIIRTYITLVTVAMSTVAMSYISPQPMPQNPASLRRTP